MFGLGGLELLLMLALPAIGAIALGRWILRMLNGQPPRVRGAEDALALEARTARLEESMAHMQEQMARLAESQEFTQKLLSERK